MDIGRLKDFLSGKLSGKDLAKLIEGEVSQHVSLLAEAGRCAPVFVTGHGGGFVLRWADIEMILRAFLRDELTRDQLVYVSNALDLSRAFDVQVDDVEEVLHLMANPEINFGMDRDLASTILGWKGRGSALTLSDYVREHRKRHRNR